MTLLAYLKVSATNDSSFSFLYLNQFESSCNKEAFYLTTQSPIFLNHIILLVFLKIYENIKFMVQEKIVNIHRYVLSYCCNY